jgi:hypothetical protein
MPEFEDIRKIAFERPMPLSEVRMIVARESEAAAQNLLKEDCRKNSTGIKEDLTDSQENERDRHNHAHHHAHPHHNESEEKHK